PDRSVPASLRTRIAVSAGVFGCPSSPPSLVLPLADAESLFEFGQSFFDLGHLAEFYADLQDRLGGAEADGGGGGVLLKRQQRPHGLLRGGGQSPGGALALSTKELIERMGARGYWVSPGGKTPAATLYSALLREINTKGAESRFRKADKGKFALLKA